METRKDLKISTCGFLESEGGVGLLPPRVEVADVRVEPPESGGSRSRSLGSGVGAELFLSGREPRGAGVAFLRSRVSRSPNVVPEFQLLVTLFQFGVDSWSGWALLGASERLKGRFWVCVYAGEVGEGCGAELGDICWPPVMVAVRCDDAANAAAEGSNDELSTKRPSCIVGEGFFGTELRMNFLVESLR